MYTCKICGEEFNVIKELSKHLASAHNYNAEQVYSYYSYSFETGAATCPICGKEFTMTKRQIDGFKKNKNKSIGCCATCSKSVRMVVQGSPLADPEVYKRTKEALMEHYGVTVPAKSKIIVGRTKSNNMNKYGFENTFQVPEFQQKSKETSLRKFGTEYAIASEEVRNKAKETIIRDYGVENVFQSEEIKKKIKEKHLENLGVEHPMQSKEIQEKMKKTNLKNIGVEYPMQSKEVQADVKKRNKSKYGVECVLQIPEIKEHSREESKKTNLKNYGVEYFCQHERCISANHKRISKINKKFQELLEYNNIKNELEFVVENYGYDLKVGNNLIEINPAFTHNTTIGPRFGNKTHEPKSMEYHMEKTNKANELGYNCIHIFDWDDWDKIVMLLKDREQIYARKCEVKKITKKEANEFLDNYHLQGSSRGNEFNYGLFYNERLVQVITFGKPRYNKNYEYELLRLCTLPEVSITGGASKLLKYFEEQINPKSIISYCDLSKFSGDVYKNIGFTLENRTAPSKHWYNIKTKRHITDNLLRQRGFDQLHNTSFGKGTSNEQLMIEHGYVEIYDCGQLVFVK